MPSPNRVDKPFPCPECGDEECAVKTSIKPWAKGNGMYHVRYRECRGCGIGFTTRSTSKTANDEEFFRIVNGENGHKGGHKSAVRIGKFIKISNHLVNQIIRTDKPLGYFSSKEFGK